MPFVVVRVCRHTRLLSFDHVLQTWPNDRIIFQHKTITTARHVLVNNNNKYYYYKITTTDCYTVQLTW